MSTGATDPTGGAGTSHGRRFSVGLFATVFCAGVVVYGLVNGMKPTEVQVPGFTVKLTDVNGAQPAIEQRLTSLEAQARSDAAAPPDGVDLSGTWRSDQYPGLRYEFMQYGNQVVVKISSDYGILGTCNGVLSGGQLQTQCQWANWSWTQGNMTLVDSNTLSERYWAGTDWQSFTLRR